MQIPQGFPLAGQINQANYAQFAAVLAQQAARQRQAQELAAQQAQQRAQQVGAARCRALQHDPACVCWLLYLVAAFSSSSQPALCVEL